MGDVGDWWGVDWTGLDRIGLDWIGFAMDCYGLDQRWTGLD